MEEYYAHNLAIVYYKYLSSHFSDCPRDSLSSLCTIFSNPPHSSSSLFDFILKLFTQMNCSLEVFILSLIYIERLLVVHPGTLTIQSCFNLVSTSVVIAHKFFDDISYKEDSYAFLTSLTNSQLASFEVFFLSEIDYSLYVSQEDYYHQYAALISCVSSILRGDVLLPLLLESHDQQGVLSLRYQTYPYDAFYRTQYQLWRQSVVAPTSPILCFPYWCYMKPPLDPSTFQIPVYQDSIPNTSLCDDEPTKTVTYCPGCSRTSWNMVHLQPNSYFMTCNCSFYRTCRPISVQSIPVYVIPGCAQNMRLGSNQPWLTAQRICSY